MYIRPLTRFIDRRDVGRRLAVELAGYRESDAILCPIICGGVPVADEIARQLHLPIDPLFIGKFGYPYDDELSYGAVSADSEVLTTGYVDPNWMEWVSEQIETKQQEAMSRRFRYYATSTIRLLAGKQVIIVDDAVASGVSMQLAIRSVRNRGASAIVVALPDVELALKQKIHPLVDDVVTLDKLPSAGAATRLYDDFAEVTFDEVITILNRHH